MIPFLNGWMPWRKHSPEGYFFFYGMRRVSSLYQANFLKGLLFPASRGGERSLFWKEKPQQIIGCCREQGILTLITCFFRINEKSLQKWNMVLSPGPCHNSPALHPSFQDCSLHSLFGNKPWYFQDQEYLMLPFFQFLLQLFFIVKINLEYTRYYLTAKSLKRR